MNKRKLINRLIWNKQPKGALILASFGMFIGLFIMFISLQSYFDLNYILNKDKDLFVKDYIVINKEVSLLNTLQLTNTGFSDKEIEEIRSNSFIDQVGLITTNQFKVGAYTDGNAELPPFYAELFFESVPDEFIDVSSSEWSWDTTNIFIPIVIPRDYLKLYNFGFAQSQNLPQISEEMASKAMADFIIEGGRGKLRMKGKIVGFTDRINSILVPEDFMVWANKTYGRYDKEKESSRLIIVCKDPADPLVSKFLADNNYEANTQQTKGSRLNRLLQLFISLVLFIGLLIIGLAFIVFFASFQLMIAKAKDTIIKLILIGYQSFYISKLYIIIYALIISLIYFISLFGLFLIKGILVKVLKEAGFIISDGINSWVIAISFIMVILILLINSLSITKQLKKLANN